MDCSLNIPEQPAMLVPASVHSYRRGENSPTRCIGRGCIWCGKLTLSTPNRDLAGDRAQPARHWSQARYQHAAGHTISPSPRLASPNEIVSQVVPGELHFALFVSLWRTIVALLMATRARRRALAPSPLLNGLTDQCQSLTMRAKIESAINFTASGQA